MTALYSQRLDSPIGTLVCICNDTSIIRLLWSPDNEAKEMGRLSLVTQTTAKPGTSNRVTDTICKELDDFFHGRKKRFSISPAFVEGSAFSQKIWRELSYVPYGHTISYQQLSHRCGCGGARAAGNAVGQNPIPILIPCHRVIRQNGELGGFGGGVERKRQLLRLEGILFEPLPPYRRIQ